jgi:cytoskeleton protein RodZ
MTEFGYATGTGAPGFGESVAEADYQPSAGALLRAAREAAGLHIAALAVSLKVPVKKLEALEQDRTDLLPDATFARALAASVCRSLKVDPGPVLARLPQGGAHLKRQTQRTPTPFRSPGERSSFQLRSILTRPAMVAGGVLLVGTLGLVFWPSLKDAAMRLAGRGSDTAATPAEPPLILELTGPNASDSGRQPATAAGTSVDGKSAASGSPSVFATPAAGETGKTTTNTDSPPIPAAGTVAAAGGVVTFSARGQSWVEVTDARGAVILRRTLAAGEVVGATGVLPMSAVVGRADSTQVEVRGKPLDLQPLSRDNVARFEVK